MARLSTVAVALVLVGACDRGTKARGGACSATAEAIVKAVARGGPPGGHKQAIADATQRCVDDHWTVAARNCFSSIESPDGVRDCGAVQLTKDQNDKLKRALALADVFEKMNDFTDKMCACKDAKCVQDVADEMRRWSEQEQKLHPDQGKMLEAETNRVTQSLQRMAKCMATGMSGTVDEHPS